MWYSGYNVISLDSQKRLAVPARYRNSITESSENKLVVTRGVGVGSPHLQIYPMNKWSEVVKQIVLLPSMHIHAQQLRRKVIGFAFELELDKSSRLLIPQALRDYASIDKQVVLSGVGATFELWDENSWNNWMSAQEEQMNFDELPSSFQQLRLT